MKFDAYARQDWTRKLYLPKCNPNYVSKGGLKGPSEKARVLGWRSLVRAPCPLVRQLIMLLVRYLI